MQQHKQVIVVRKDLNMRKGKIAAQAAHASMAAILKQATKHDNSLIIDLSDSRINDWITGNFKKVCVSVDSEEELITLYEKAKDKGFICSLICDAGLTEFAGVPTNTCIAIGPGLPSDIDTLTGNLKLL